MSIKYNKEDIKKIFEIIEDKDILLEVKYSDKQIEESKKLARNLSIPNGDALHAILARDNRAILVTRDVHFNELTKIVTVKKPEDII